MTHLVGGIHDLWQVQAATGCRQRGCSNISNVLPVWLALACYRGLDESTTLASLPPLYERDSGKNPDEAQQLDRNRAAQTAGDETALETHQHHEASLHDKAHSCDTQTDRHTRRLSHTPDKFIFLSCDVAWILIFKLSSSLLMLTDYTPKLISL